MSEIIVADRRIYYESHGRGLALVLIRGLGSNADHWYAQLPEFSKHYRVIIFDNRGIARSDDPGGSFTIADMAQDTIALMDGLKIDQAHILGISMGGMIAQEIAIGHPQRVRGLVLGVTHCGGKLQVAAAADVTQKLRRMVVENTLESRIEAAGVFFAARTLMENPQAVQEYAAVSMRHPAGPEILQRQWNAVGGHDACERLALIQAPTLVLTGEEDVLIPTRNATLVAERIPGAELVVIPGGGHQVMIEQPQACNRAILDFLGRVDSVQ